MGSAAYAAADSSKHFEIKAKPLADALMEFGVQSGLTVVAPTTLTAGKKAAGVRGDLAPTDALGRLLIGSGLTFARAADGTIAIQAVASNGPAQAGAGESGLHKDLTANPDIAEIVVTAEKREERLQDVPIAVTVVSAKQLDEQHVYTIADLARTTPSLEVIQAFGNIAGGGQIRGIGTNSGANTAEGSVGIVVDGVPQGNVNANNIFDMQRVEVLRGPQGTLFGLTTSAGVINMITVAPDPSKLSSFWHVDYSNKSTAGSKFGETLARGVVNIPLSTNSALRVSVSGDLLNGVERNNFNGEDNYSHDFGVRARYRLDASDELEINLIADFDRRTQNYDDPQFTYAIVPAGSGLAAELSACGIAASFGNQSRCAAQAQRATSKNWGISSEADWTIAGLTLTSITGYRINSTGPSSADVIATPQEVPQIFRINDQSYGRQFSQELRVTSPNNGTIEYVAGLFYSDFHGTTGFAPGGSFNIGIFAGSPPTFNAFVQDASSTYTSVKSAAAFGQMTYHVTNQISVIAGARYTHEKLTDASSANPLDPTSAPSIGGATDSNVSGKVGLQYKISPAWSSYLTATRGYKGPIVQPAAPGGPPAASIPAEIPTAFELGVRGTTWDGALLVDADLFYTTVKNYQGQRGLLNSVGNLTFTPESVDIVTKGVELGVYGRPMQNLSLAAGFIYDIAQYPSDWTGSNPDDLRDPLRDANGKILSGPGTTSLANRQLQGVPKAKFTLSGEYSHAVGNFEGYMGADTVYKSAMLMGPSGDSRFIYPAHWTVGARIGVRGAEDRWNVALFARNLTDEHEPVVIFAGPAYIPPGGSGVPGGNDAFPNGKAAGISTWLAPTSLRQVGISVEFRF